MGTGEVNGRHTPWRQWGSPLILLGLVTLMPAGLGPDRPDVASAATPQIKAMTVSILPEYDQPRVLVSYRGQIEGASLPLDLSLRLPADAEVSHACVLKPPNDSHVCQPYTTEVQDDSLLLNYQIPLSTFYAEYYYSSFSGVGERSFDFTLWPPFPVDSLEVWVQEPPDAIDFSLSPEPATVLDQGGFRHDGYTYENVSPDEPVSAHMTYFRQDSQPVAARPAAGTASDDRGGQQLVLILSLAGMAIVSLAAFAFISRRRRLRAARASYGPADRGDASESSGWFFCSHCGADVHREFRFCPRCGGEPRRPPGEEAS